jgi:hypothetical protein
MEYIIKTQVSSVHVVPPHSLSNAKNVHVKIKEKRKI